MHIRYIRWPIKSRKWKDCFTTTILRTRWYSTTTISMISLTQLVTLTSCQTMLPTKLTMTINYPIYVQVSKIMPSYCTTPSTSIWNISKLNLSSKRYRLWLIAIISINCSRRLLLTRKCRRNSGRSRKGWGYWLGMVIICRARKTMSLLIRIRLTMHGNLFLTVLIRLVSKNRKKTSKWQWAISSTNSRSRN